MDDRVKKQHIGLKAVAVLIAASLFLLHIYPYLAGYRLTADDVQFHYQYMLGPVKAWDHIKSVATTQGRIVHFIDLPFSMFGAYHADSIVFRGFYTIFYFTNFFLIGKYVSTISGVKVSLLVTLVLASLHPLEYQHFPPNAYPFHLSIPLFLILVSRLMLWSHTKLENPRPAPEITWSIVCFIGMMFSEYGFIFASAIMSLEFLAKVNRRCASGYELLNSATYCFSHNSTRRDACLVALFLLFYLGFRFFYPSTYEGNQLSNHVDWPIVFKTLYGHIVGGTSFSTFSRNHLSFTLLTENLRNSQMLAAGFVTAGTYVMAHLLLKNQLYGAKRQRQTPFLAIAIGSLGFSLFVTFPLVATSKYQYWCQAYDVCHFLDSRVSYLGLGVFITAFALAALRRLRSFRILGAGAVVALSAILAFSSLLNYLSNLHMMANMENYVAGWKRARGLACLDNNSIKNLQSKLPDLLDPGSRMSFHPQFDREGYWITYILDRKKQNGCDMSALLSAQMNLKLSGSENRLALEDRFAYLEGWSNAEPWGRWSTGVKSKLLLPIRKESKTIQLNMIAYVSPSHPQQHLSIEINGLEVFLGILTQRNGNQFSLTIPATVMQKIQDEGLILIEFSHPDAISPKELHLGGDTRSLAIGLKEITVQSR